MNKNASEEFAFIRDKLEKIASILVQDGEVSLKEACFLIGCLHNICNENSFSFKDKTSV